jgi:hypothetical protein
MKSSPPLEVRQTDEALMAAQEKQLFFKETIGKRSWERNKHSSVRFKCGRRRRRKAVTKLGRAKRNDDTAATPPRN